MKKRRWLASLAALLVLAAAGGGIAWTLAGRGSRTAAETLEAYTEALNQREYGTMYRLLDEESRRETDEETFTERNGKIYEGIEAENITVEILSEGNENRTSGRTTQSVTYQMTMDTLAGEVSFRQTAVFHKDGREDYLLSWNDGLIFPNLQEEDKVRVETLNAQRGSIYDRNGILLAGQGVVSSVGLVPGKMSGEPEDLQRLAELLDTTVDAIQNKLSAFWVKDDSFVPIREIKKSGLDMEVLGKASMNEPSSDSLAGQLLEIPGVMVTDASERVYPLGEAAAHLVGYVQNITAEELEKHEGEGYTTSSVIGKSGVESLYEEELRGSSGGQIMIVDEDGADKELVLRKEAVDGTDITLTVDAELQRQLYEVYQEDQSVSVAMNPRTGEVLALVSTPAYDNNLFVLGMSENTWNAIRENEAQPMLNRFRATFVPGSSFKPIIAGIGLSTGTLDAEEDMGAAGTSWQKDESWGNYYVTTLHGTDPANLENAMVLSDNIYFARAALNMGQETLTEQLDRLGFNERVPFDIWTTESTYANEEGEWTEIQLADSGYGQGQILVNPLHLAAMYSAFVNGGDMIEPYLRVTEDRQPTVWVENAFTEEAAETVKNDMIQVVEQPEGTAHGCRMEGVTLAGKTGTAEIKDSQEDTDGIELGWLGILTPDREMEDSFLLMTMVQDVRDRGGSGYVVSKTMEVLPGILGEQAVQ
ncbi:MAG TPA: penicillin-binding transpeptidase domain-containing protein [Candidatus Fusicatenibacter intestinigallinarum]|uniref:Penicillin-binding transpeptidase domain-containing protein n=1 Tax=Candidatus Fusicatenibacter intestinigallinarum TaxID=2838598 RepID=A0A9D2SN21_9FIRM|nr:penicillin-binding transpeptidase domain-containing protein [Candidatus Fusicatenibacter intestinigallinarum]